MLLKGRLFISDMAFACPPLCSLYTAWELTPDTCASFGKHHTTQHFPAVHRKHVSSRLNCGVAGTILQSSLDHSGQHDCCSQLTGNHTPYARITRGPNVKLRCPVIHRKCTSEFILLCYTSEVDYSESVLKYQKPIKTFPLYLFLVLLCHAKICSWHQWKYAQLWMLA